jgi:hypothetical protein
MANRLVIAGPRDTTNNRSVWAFNEDGTLAWSYDTGGDTKKVLVSGNYVFIVGTAADNGDGNGTRNLWKLNLSNSSYAGGRYCKSASIAWDLALDSIGRIIVSVSGGAVRVAANLASEETIISSGTSVFGACAVDLFDDSIYIGSGGTPLNLYKYYSDLTLAWTKDPLTSVSTSGIGVLSNRKIIAVIYSKIYCWDKDGNQQWYIDRYSERVKISGNDKIYIIARDGAKGVQELSETDGSELWFVATNGWLDDGFITSDNSSLYACGSYAKSFHVYKVDLSTHKIYGVINVPPFAEMTGVSGSSVFAFNKELNVNLEGAWLLNDNVASLVVKDETNFARNGTASYNSNLFHSDGKINGAFKYDNSTLYAFLGTTPASNLAIDSVNDWGGQSFTLLQNQSFQTISLYLKRGIGDDVGTISLSIKNTDGSGHPTGGDLAIATLPSSSVAESWGWVQFTFPSVVNLTSSTKYALVLRASGANSSNILYWSFDGAGKYAGGCLEWSTDGGSSWTSNTSYDCWFKIGPYTIPLVDFGDADAFDLPVGKHLTVSFWYKWVSGGTTFVYPTILHKIKKNTYPKGIVVFADTGATKKVQVSLYWPDGTNTTSIVTLSSIEVWHFVVVRINRDKTIHISVDNGQYFDEDSISAKISTDLSNTTPLLLGDTVGAKDGQTTALVNLNFGPLDGVVDNLAVWSRLLTGVEEEQLWNNGNGSEDYQLYEAPVIIGQSGDTTVALGQPVNLFVTATGDPSPSYQWYKDDIELTGKTNSTLSFYADYGDAGTYKCRAYNVAGEVYSDPATLTVTTNPWRYNLFRLQSDIDRS